MQVTLVRWLLLGALIGSAGAQIVVPSTPKRPVTRPIGGGNGVNGGASIHRSGTESAKRYITYISLSDTRSWQSTDGKTLQGKLIAFEDVVIEAPPGVAEPPAPVPPKHPTAVRDGKVRLLVDKKTFEIPLSRLVQGDQDFVTQIKTALAAKAAAQQ